MTNSGSNNRSHEVSDRGEVINEKYSACEAIVRYARVEVYWGRFPFLQQLVIFSSQQTGEEQNKVMSTNSFLRCTTDLQPPSS